MASVGCNPGDMSCAIDEQQERSRDHRADDERGEHRKLEHEKQRCEDVPRDLIRASRHGADLSRAELTAGSDCS